MNPTRHLLASLALLALGFVPALSAADTPDKSKNGYTVTLEMQVDESGKVEDAKVISSNDTSSEHLLEKTAFRRARDLKLAPHLKDGKPVKFTARAPFFFAVEGDEGPEDPAIIKPRILKASRPVYPPQEAAKGEVGAVILDAMIGTDGKVSDLKVLRSSGPVFEKAATDSVTQWTFVPATQNGSPIASHWRMSICFETEVLAADWTWHIAPRPSIGNYTVVHRIGPDAPTAAAAQPPEPPAEKK
jgi:protein TonB